MSSALVFPSVDVYESYTGRGGREEGRNWGSQFENQLVFSSSVHLWELSMRFPLGVFVPLCQASGSTLCEEDASQAGWPHHPRKCSGYSRFFYFLLALSFACWGSRMDPVPPDVPQHGPLLAPRHVGFPQTIQMSVHPQSRKTTRNIQTNKRKAIRSKDKSKIA